MIRTRFKLANWEEIAIRQHGATQLRRIVTPHPPERYVEVYPETVVPGIPEWLWSRATSGQGAEQQDLFWLKNKPVERIGDKICHVCKDGSRIEFLVRKVDVVPADHMTEDDAKKCGMPATEKDWKYSESILGLGWNAATLGARVSMFWFWVVKRPYQQLLNKRVWKIDVEVLKK